MNRLLLIAYFYPPLGGPAVQRPAKTVKYLTRLGWEVDVITVDGILYHSSDRTLEQECSHKRVFRTASLDPMYLLNKAKKLISIPVDKLYQGAAASHKGLIKHLFPIDEKIGWLPFIIKAGRQALRTKPYNAVMVTCNPFSASLAGAYLAKQARIPFIMDYRDHWTLNNAIEQPKGLLYRLYQQLERHILSQATLVTTATKVMKQDLMDTFGKGLEAKIMPFFNGWDEADFVDLLPSQHSSGYPTISYLGTLYRDRTLAPFLHAVRALLPSYPALRIQLIGNFNQETITEIDQSKIKANVMLINQLSHQAALQEMSVSDILLLVIGDDKLKWVLTGKLFEYLRCQKPIIALIPPNGEAAEIMKECGHDGICDIHSQSDITATLDRIIKQSEAGSFSFSIPFQYERSRQVQNLANRLQTLIR